ncbi:MAG: hypothetical protein ACTSYA_12820 [Candidatus Kariarchaeaceae archaeon]
MIGLIALVYFRPEKLFLMIALISGLSWICVREWLPIEFWSRRNLIRGGKKGIRQWVSILTGGSFFVGTPIVLINVILYAWNENEHRGLVMGYIVFILFIISTRVKRESSLKKEGDKYEKNGFSTYQQNFKFYAIILLALMMISLTIPASKEMIYINLILILEGGAQYNMAKQNMTKTMEKAIMTKKHFDFDLARQERDKMEDRRVELRGEVDTRVW